MIKLKKIPLIIKLIVLLIFLAVSLSPLFPTVSQKNDFFDVFFVRFIPLIIGLAATWFLFSFSIRLKITSLILAIFGLAMFIFIQGGIFSHKSIQIVNISGRSMNPTYKDGAILAARTLVQNDRLYRGDVIFFKVPKEPFDKSISRIIGLPGDAVLIKEGVFFLDRKKINEPYVPQGMKISTVPNGFQGEGQEMTVTQNGVYVLGDNREKSIDSRRWGFVPAENIDSIVIFCIWKCR